MASFNGLLKCLLLFCLTVCTAETYFRGMISGYFGRGRPDVFYNGQWGSIGNTNWGNNEAAVFCRSLGFSSGTAIPSSELYNRRQIIWLDNVNCRGNETNLDQCSHLGWGQTTVDSKQSASEIVAGVQCFGDVVRISGGKSQGRAEIFHYGKWGSVAADHWDDKDAKVFCSMLGFRSGKATRLPAVPPIFKNVHCTGNETTIHLCPKQDYLTDVSLDDVAGVKCEGKNVRIVGGRKKGRAEIFYEDQWGTVCDSPGNNDAATVFCRMLGFWTGRYPSQATTVASPNTRIWIQEYSCTGNESTLAQCAYRNLKNTTCTHDEDIEVSCSNVQARIMSPDSNFIGRAELFFDGQWLPICENTMTQQVAHVFCRTLGLRFEYMVPSTKATSNSLHLVKVDCTGQEDSIQQCTGITWSSEKCGSNKEAFLKCSGDTVAQGSQKNVIVYHGNTSGSVCTDSWQNSDADVYCRMLGYREGKALKIPSPVNKLDFHMTRVNCHGDEFNLFQCSYQRETNGCDETEVAAANCTGTLVRIRSVPGNKYKGRAEIFYDGKWGSICSNYWDEKSAKVFCKMLGYDNGIVFDPYEADIPTITDPVWLSDVTCTGNENNILQCGHTDWGDHQCIHEYDTGVECS